MLLVRRNNDSNWLNNWFDDTLFDVDLMPQTKATAPAINVLETPKDYKMEMAVNNDGLLHVAIENKMEHKEEERDNKEEKHERYLRREFGYSNYEQCYTLPEDVDHDHITASVADGILTITVPKITPEQEAKVMKNIEVK